MDRAGWQRALDMQMDTMKWCQSDIGMRINAGIFESMTEKIIALPRKPEYSHIPDEIVTWDQCMNSARDFQSLLWQADTCYVTADMQQILLQAAHDLPDEIMWDDHVLLTPRGFCLFEEAMHGQDRHGSAIGVSAIAWELSRFADYDDSLMQSVNIYFLTDSYDEGDEINESVNSFLRDRGVPIPPLALAHWYPGIIGTNLPIVSGQGSELICGVVRLFQAFNLLAQQKIGAPIKLNPDRAQRKRYHREYPDGPERMITLITLRRKSVKKDDEEPQKVEWSRRWVVRGHWRRQYYRSTKRHEWVYIYEHIKGPDDKPLIITDRRVFNFRR